MKQFARQNLLIGEDQTRILQGKRVAILGLGGVGGACLEGVLRTGVGALLLVDNDCFDVSNLNRQLLCTHHTVGKQKTHVAKQRVQAICPETLVQTGDFFYDHTHNQTLLDFGPDFIIDCIDSVTSKLDLMQFIQETQIPGVSCLGTGNRLSPFSFTYGTIESTAGSGDPLARVLRKESKKRGIHGHPVVYARALPQSKNTLNSEESTRHAPGSIAFVPPVAGFLCASVCIHSLLGWDIPQA